MTVEKIYFDMDGVLADFNRGVKEILGIEPMDQDSATKDYDDRLFQAIKTILFLSY